MANAATLCVLSLDATLPRSGKAKVQNQTAPSTAVSLCYRSLLKCLRTSACHALKHSFSGNNARNKVVSLRVARRWIASSLYASSLNAGLNTESLFAAYIDLKVAFDSLDRESLWNILKIIGTPQKIIDIITMLYTTLRKVWYA